MRLSCWLAAIVLFAMGCRTMPPDLKPPKQGEVLRAPPLADARYDTPSMPKEAFNDRELARKTPDNTAILPTRGPGPMGVGGMGPGAGRGGY